MIGNETAWLDEASDAEPVQKVLSSVQSSGCVSGFHWPGLPLAHLFRVKFTCWPQSSFSKYIN